MTALDYTVVAVYLAVVAWIGLAVRQSKNTFDYFLGSRNVAWWAAGLSVLGTETSALTVVGAPIQSLRGDWTYLQLAFGSVLGRIFVSYVLLPIYYRSRVFTVYDFLGERFGPRTRDAGSALFFVGRVLGSGVRLYGGAIALVISIGVSFPAAMALISTVAVLYTVSGGLRSVIWTDVLQALLFIGGGALALGLLIHDSGGLAAVSSALASGLTPTGQPKLRLFNLALDPSQAYTLAAGICGSVFLTMATHGTDQDMIQRCFAVSDERGARRSMLLSALMTIPIAGLFLSVGSVLWVAFGGDSGTAAVAGQIAAERGLASAAKGYDFIFPHYVAQNFPAGVRGLVMAAILAASMSSLDSAIAALASTGVTCVWRPYVRPDGDDAYYLRVSRWMSLGFGVLIAGVAVWTWLAEDTGGESSGFGVLMLGLKVLSWIFPPLLGIFLVGVFTRRGNDGGNLTALAAGIGVLLAVEVGWLGEPPPFAWTWNALVGCAVTAAVAALFPPGEKKSSESKV